MLSPGMNPPRQRTADRTPLPEIGFCPEKNRLLEEFLEASREMIGRQNEQTKAVIQGDADFPRFDVLLHLAQERKEMAKYALIARGISRLRGGLSHMGLTQVEKERISDSRMKLQSVAHSLNHIDPKKVPGFEDIQVCLDEAEKNLSGALRATAAEKRDRA